MDALAVLQRWMYGAIGGELNAFAADRDWLALAAVLPLGIAFGAIHALTPGHGKTVLASYLAGSPLAIWRGLATAATLALTHIASAVVLALLAAPLISRSLVGAGRAPLLEDVSRGLWRRWARGSFSKRFGEPGGTRPTRGGWSGRSPG